MTGSGVGDLRGQVFALYILGIVELDQERSAVALDRFGEGLAVARRAGYRYGEAHLRRSLADAHAAQGETDRATVLLRQATAIFRQLGAPEVRHSRWLSSVSCICARAG